jgi:2-polyprenyl-6-methoxyphenol hydroxylase-like FAD-dependent oxidoreductase
MDRTGDATETLRVTCCIAGGGPAGMMLGLLLARAGIRVAVLEKHADFLRDFRGDTIHPSTLEVMYELGLLGELLRRPHQQAQSLGGEVGDVAFTLADFTHLRTFCKFVAFMPQWEFLDFLAAAARRYPTFELRLETAVTELLREDDRVIGAIAATPKGPLFIRADLVVGADGRHSKVREEAGLEILDIGAPIDVLWLRLSKRFGDADQSLGHADRGRILVMIDRGVYWQCAFVIAKGSLAALRERGLPAFRDEIARLAHLPPERLAEIADWDDVSLLTVTVDRLRRWYRPGLLCIGDAAHAMSPIGGVGINLAIQDAVAAANILGPPLRRGEVTSEHLRQVQRRREWPTRATQFLQVFLQNRVLARVLASTGALTPPWPLRLLQRWPYLRRFPARLIGIGFRPEHVRKRSPE